jgi:hypothetical protein
VLIDMVVVVVVMMLMITMAEVRSRERKLPS